MRFSQAWGGDVFGPEPVGKVRQRRLASVIKQQVHTDAERFCPAFNGLHGWNRVSTFDSHQEGRGISCELPKFPMAEPFGFAEMPKSVAKNHLYAPLGGGVVVGQIDTIRFRLYKKWEKDERLLLLMGLAPCGALGER